MAKKKKPRAKIGALGPQPYWLRMSPLERARTKQYIKEGLQGYERADGVKVPGIRSVYKGFEASSGYDLTHVERWSAAKLKRARESIQSLNTLTSRPFAVITPRNAKQRREARKVTGQDLPSQKKMIYHVQNAKLDKVIFRDNKIVVERKFTHGSSTIKQDFLFRDYQTEPPYGFLNMAEITKKMIPDMPERYRGQANYFTILTRQYGPVGESVLKKRLLEHLNDYYAQYERAGSGAGHETFAEQVIGWRLIGTYSSMKAHEILSEQNKSLRRKMKKLRFSKNEKQCTALEARTGKRCILTRDHKGSHKFKRR